MLTYPLWPFAVYCVAVIAVVGAMLGVSSVLGQRHRDRETDEPFESGILTTGSARVRLSAKFYLIAMFFVIFDLEAVFIFAWTISFREAGIAGYLAVLAFIVILLVVLIYLWLMGALDWGSSSRQSQNVKQERT